MTCGNVNAPAPILADKDQHFVPLLYILVERLGLIGAGVATVVAGRRYVARAAVADAAPAGPGGGNRTDQHSIEEEIISHNTLIHRIVRPAVRGIASTGVTPNQLTTLRLVTGIAAAAGFAVGGTAWPHVGGVIFILSMLLDRADGELARQTGQSSLSGYRYDLICDCTANVIAFVGIGIGLAGGTLGYSAVILGILAGFGIAVLFWQLNVAKLHAVPGYALWGGRVTVDPDDAMVFVPILIWCGWVQPMLIAAAAITPAAALWLWISAVRSGGKPGGDAARS